MHSRLKLRAEFGGNLLATFKVIVKSGFCFCRATHVHSAVYAMTRCLSDCLSVCHKPVLYPKGCNVRDGLQHKGNPRIITFRVRRSRGEMYIGYGRLCVCLSVPRHIPHYCTDPDITWGSGRGAF